MENNTFKKIIQSIAKKLSTEADKRNTALENTLKIRLEKANFDERKYVNSLKFNLILYKNIIRNTELELAKWLENKNVPSKEERELILSKVMENSKAYTQNAIKSNGKTLNQIDLKAISAYQKLEGESLKEKLETDYKYLNIYNDILKIFINELEKINLEDVELDDIKEVIKCIKTDIIKASNYILKSTQKKSADVSEKVEEKEETPEIKTLESKILEYINHLTPNELSKKMKQVYIECCKMEDTDPNEEDAYRFGPMGIYQYMTGVILLDLVEKREQKLIKGAIRLLIIGEFTPNNFVNFIEHIITKELNINEESCREIISRINSKFALCADSYLAEKNNNPQKDIDIDEYVFILDNAEENEKFKREKVQEATDEEDYESDAGHKKKGPKRLLKVVTILLIIGGLVGGGFYIGTSLNNGGEEPTQPTTGVEPEDEGDEPETTTEVDPSEYFIVDSDSRYITLDELTDFTEVELGYIRNEIYARHGIAFKDGKYKDYFSRKSWYAEDPTFKGDSEELNKYERANAEIVRLEELTRSSSTLKIDNTYHKVDYDLGDVYYSVHTASFNDYSNAQDYINELDDKGIYAIADSVDDFYRIKVGSAYTIEMAEAIEAELESKSMDAYILACDKEIESKLDDVEDLSFTGYYEEFEKEYYALKQELKGKKYYGAYLQKLEDIYENTNI